MNKPPSAQELDEVLEKLGMEPQELFRSKDPLYAELANKELTRDEAIKALIEHPSLMQRPIVVMGDKAIVARPAERAKEIL